MHNPLFPSTCFAVVMTLGLAEPVTPQCDLYHLSGGDAADGAGDVDGDGHADVIVSDIYYPNGYAQGRAWVYSGKDGTVLHTFDGVAKGSFFGYSVAGLGDVDKDGYPDVGVGATRISLAYPGYVRVFSGKNGRVLLTVTQVSYVHGIGDVNGDGHADFATDLGLVQKGLRANSGKDGSVLHTWTTAAAIDRVPDLDSDGCGEVILGFPSLSKVRVVSGKTGKLLFEVVGKGFGNCVALAGDVDGDKTQDLVVGAEGGGGRTFCQERTDPLSTTSLEVRMKHSAVTSPASWT